MVSTKFLTDRVIALSFVRTGKSLDIGWGVKDRLISLNPLETREIAIRSIVFLSYLYLKHQIIKKGNYLPCPL